MHFWFGKKENEEPEKAVKTPQTVTTEVPKEGDNPSVSPSVKGTVPAPQPAAPAAVPAASSVPPAANTNPAVVLRPVKSVQTGTAEAHAVGVAPPSAKVRVRQDSRALYTQLMNGLYDAVLVLDDRGRVIDTNGRVLSILGYTRDEAWDLPITSIITGMTQPMLDKLKTALKSSPHALISSRCFRKDGTYFTGEVGVCLCALMRGSSFVMTIRNTASREKATEELGLVHASFLALPVAAFICTPEGQFSTVNPAFLEMFRMSDTGAAKAARLTDLLPETTGAFLKAASGVRSIETFELPQAAEGEPSSISVALAPLMRGQEVASVAGTIYVLSRKKAEEEVK